MESYKHEVRIDFVTALGRADQNIDGDQVELDQEIFRLARQALKGVQMKAFYYAFRCEDSWEEISEIFRVKFGKNVKPDTVREYGGKAKNNLSLELTELSKKSGGWLKS